MLVLLAHLELIGRRDWSALCRLCGTAREALTRCVAEIRTLNPKPALVFDYAMAQPVIARCDHAAAATLVVGWSS